MFGRRGWPRSSRRSFVDLKLRYPTLRLIFVEADPDVLLRRYSVARRPHPLRDGAIEHSIAAERSSLAAVRELADLIVDTTKLSPHDLRRQVLTLGFGDSDRPRVSPSKSRASHISRVCRRPRVWSSMYGSCRIPYFEEELRTFSGDDEPVKKWLTGQEEVEEAIRRIVDLVLYLVPTLRR